MRLAPALFLTCVSIGCAAAPTDSGAAALAIPRALQLAGCYQLERSAWEETGQNIGLVPPTELRLDTLESSWRFATYEARHATPELVRHAEPAVGRVRPAPGMWYPVGPDSLRVQWNSGFSTAGYQLAVRGDSVTGIATTHSDHRLTSSTTREVLPDPTAAVRGVRVPCDR